MIQSSKTTHDLFQTPDERNQHPPVKQVRSQDVTDHRHRRQDKSRQHSQFDNNRSKSSSFRHSIRNLTSCTLLRRKSSRATSRNSQSSSSKAESNTINDIDEQQSLKAQLIPARSCSSSPSSSKYNCHAESPTLSTIDDTSSDFQTRDPLEEKKSGEMPSKPINISELNSHLEVRSTSNIDKLSAKSQLSSSKEISTSLVNLMGTTFDSVPTNNTPQMPTHVVRPRKPSFFRFLQHISSTPTSSVDRIRAYGSSSNVDTIDAAEPSPLSTTSSIGNNNCTNGLSNPCMKSANQYIWCYESSVSIHTSNSTSVDECLPHLEIDHKPLIYREQFEPTEHFNWYGISDSHGPVIISYKYSNDQENQRYVMAIVRTRQRTSIESLTCDSSSSVDILKRICDQCSITDVEYFDPILCDGAHDSLIKYDESYVSNTHKFGIVYQRENQLTEEDIFSNETHNSAMDRFLDLIGSRVKLKDFQGYRGGLDVKSDHTGTESIYEQFHNHEIMFHVSTLLPHSKIERQQLERKRHIGNDIVAIIFQEKETKFNPECIASQFLHVYLIVTPLDNNGAHYKVTVVHRDSVPMFGPLTNESNSFHADQSFKQWLLTKLLNAEFASCKASTFQKYQERTRMNLFENLYRILHDRNRPFMNYLFNNSQYKRECDVEQQKDDAPILSPRKTYDRHADNSLLGSVRRRLISSKLRAQHSLTPPPPTTIIISAAPTADANDPKSRMRSMTMDLKQSASRESIASNGSNGKTSSVFSSNKNNMTQAEKLLSNRSLSEQHSTDPSLSSRSSSKYLSPNTRSTPTYDSNESHDSHSPVTEFLPNKSSCEENDHRNCNQFLSDDFQSSSKDDLIKYVYVLQQQHSMKLAEINEHHSKVLKQLELQLIQQRHIGNGENS